MDIRNLFFKSRSFTPIPILLMMLYFARPNSPYFFLGIVLIAIGEIIRLRSVSFAGGETRTMNVGASSICKSGPYSIVRNPLYIGNMMIYVGFAFVAGSVYVVTISLITLIGLTSVCLGLDKGIKRLSQVNMILASSLMVFIFIFDNSIF